MLETEIHRIEKLSTTELQLEIATQLRQISSELLFEFFQNQIPHDFWKFGNRPALCLLTTTKAFESIVIEFLHSPKTRIEMVQKGQLSIKALTCNLIAELTDYGERETSWFIYSNKIAVFLQPILLS